MNELLGAATARLDCAFGLLLVPERRIELEHVHNKVQGVSLRLAVGGLHRHLIAWAQRHREPLVINGNAAAATISADFKLLSVPVGREGGRVVGVLVFCNRHIFLACHLGRQLAALVDAQFDLMTVHTRWPGADLRSGPRRPIRYGWQCRVC